MSDYNDDIDQLLDSGSGSEYEPETNNMQEVGVNRYIYFIDKEKLRCRAEKPNLIF